MNWFDIRESSGELGGFLILVVVVMAAAFLFLLPAALHIFRSDREKPRFARECASIAFHSASTVTMFTLGAPLLLLALGLLLAGFLAPLLLLVGAPNSPGAIFKVVVGILLATTLVSFVLSLRVSIRRLSDGAPMKSHYSDSQRTDY